jgi:hypothetical protein
MPLSLAESQALADIGKHLYPFLPGKAHPYADQMTSFEGVARRLGLARYWPGGSKLPALTTLLSGVLEYERGRFFPLIVEIVRAGVRYRQGKGPVTREEVERLNELIAKVRFKIPELHDSTFLAALPRLEPAPIADRRPRSKAGLEKLQRKLVEITKLPAQERGYQFERFLGDLFEAHELAPRAAFRLVGEQIDGSLQFQGQTYLVEARWQAERVAAAELLVFSGKVGGKAEWSRGLCISMSGFSDDGLEGFARGRATNVICMDGLNLYHIMHGGLDLRIVIERKARLAAETNRSFVAVRELFPDLI